MGSRTKVRNSAFPPSFPIGPLLEVIEVEAVRLGRGFWNFASELGLSGEQIKKGYVGERRLDRICCELGLHPRQIYRDYHDVINEDALEVSA